MIRVNLLRGENERRERHLAQLRNRYATDPEFRAKKLAAQKQSRDADPEKFRARTRKSYAKNPEPARVNARRYRKLYPDRVRRYSREWEERNRVASMLRRARTRADAAGVAFDITPDDIIIPEFCPVLPWIRLEHARGQATHASPALDRMIPALGYVRGNVRVISTRANWIKGDVTFAEISRVAEYVRAIEAGHGEQG